MANDKLKEISPEELAEILKQHQLFIDTNGKEGAKADLTETNLKGAVLQEADLQGADFTGADLQRADLQGAVLQGADLQGADLQEADLQGAKLQWADLSGAKLLWAKLQGAIFQQANLQEINLLGAHLMGTDLRQTGLQHANLQKADLAGAQLQEANLSGADLSGAKGLLPEALAGANLSNAKLPEGLSVDKGLDIVNDASKHSQKLFFMLLLACFYVVLTIAATTDPALLTNSTSTPLPIIGASVQIVDFYWTAPIFLFVLYAYFLLYMQRVWEKLAEFPAVFPNGKTLDDTIHQWVLNGLVLSHFKQLRQDRPHLHRFQMFLSGSASWGMVPVILGLVWKRCLSRHDPYLTYVHVLLIVFGVVAGVYMYILMRRTLRQQSTKFTCWKKPKFYFASSPLILLAFGGFFISNWAITGGVHADFYEAEISIKPDNWSKKTDADLVKGVNLKGANLIGVDAEKAFLVNADLREANLYEASLEEANLQRAKLQRANLQGADLQRAKLHQASLQGAKLQGAKLQKTILEEANFVGAEFQKAYLQRATLQGANLQHANLQEANLQQANLQQANLYNSNLQRATLQGADLQGANLQWADLRGADLSTAQGLTEAQLKGAKIDHTTKLPPDLQHLIPKEEQKQTDPK